MTEHHDGRTGFGIRLRQLREEAELSGKELAERLGWPASKVSRLENGRQTASADDVRAWATALSAPTELRDELVSDLRSLRVEYATWRRQYRSGLAPRQKAGVVLEHSTTLLRAYLPPARGIVQSSTTRGSGRAVTGRACSTKNCLQQSAHSISIGIP